MSTKAKPEVHEEDLHRDNKRFPNPVVTVKLRLSHFEDMIGHSFLNIDQKYNVHNGKPKEGENADAVTMINIAHDREGPEKCFAQLAAKKKVRKAWKQRRKHQAKEDTLANAGNVKTTSQDEAAYPGPIGTAEELNG